MASIMAIDRWGHRDYYHYLVSQKFPRLSFRLSARVNIANCVSIPFQHNRTVYCAMHSLHTPIDQSSISIEEAIYLGYVWRYCLPPYLSHSHSSFRNRSDSCNCGCVANPTQPIQPVASCIEIGGQQSFSFPSSSLFS